MAKSKKTKRAESVGTSTPGPSAPAGPTSSQRLFADLRLAAIVLLLVGAIYATYRGSLSGRLFFDDHAAIETNTNVHALVNPATRWKWATWVKAAGSDIESPLSGRPVVTLSFALNHWWATSVYPSKPATFEGVAPRHIPFFHYVNLGLHMVVTVLLFALVRRTLRAPNFAGALDANADAWAFCFALLWAVHPLNTETVVYVTQRTEQIVSLFLLATLYCSARALDAGGPRSRLAWELAAVAACLLGMGSKENMFAAPLLLVAYDRAFRFPDWRSTLRARPWFYLAIFATWGLLAAIVAQNPRGASVGFGDERLPWYEYLITQCWCLWRYVWLTLIPLGSKLCVDYGRRPVLEFHHTAPGALLVFTLLGVTAWGWLRRPWVGFLGTWFFLILAPTSSFYPIVTEVGAERRMYLPSAAILMGAFAGVVAIAQLLRARAKTDSDVPPGNRLLQVGLVATAILALVLGATSVRRIKVYENDLTLYGHIVDVFPDNDRGCNNYGKICIDHKMFEAALGLFNRAIKIDPEYVDALTNRAIIFLGEGLRAHIDYAIADSSAAINWQPWGTNPLNNRATAYMDADLFDLAQADFDRLIALSPRTSDIRFNQANLFFRRGETDPKYYEKALASVDQALALNPNSYRCYNTRGTVLLKLDRPEESAQAFSQALEMIRLEAQNLPPGSDIQRCWLAVDQALNTITAARRTVDPKVRDEALLFPHRATMSMIFNNRAGAYQSIAKLLKKPRYYDFALDDLTRASFLDDSNPKYYLFRGELYLERERYGEAMMDFDTTLQLAPKWIDALRGRMKVALKTGETEVANRCARDLRKLGIPLDAATTALVNDVLNTPGDR